MGDPNFLATAALTLVTVVAIETVLLGVIIAIRDQDQFTAMRGKLKIGTFIGATSMLGSVGWFTAMTLEQASYVRAFGQIEFVFAMLVSIYWSDAPMSVWRMDFNWSRISVGTAWFSRIPAISSSE